MRALFVRAAAAPPGNLGRTDVVMERRSPIDRRVPDDRRIFPPRIEGRRMGFGRRSTDPVD
jgi:hypothetical protein